MKVYSKEEKLDGMSEDELARRLGMTLLSNTTECSCDVFETEEECIGSGLGCQWRPLFESCHPPEMIDDGVPICETTEPPTLSPTVSIERMLQETEAPTVEEGVGESEAADDIATIKEEGGWITHDLTNMFKTREHEVDNISVEEDETDGSGGRRQLLVSSDKDPDTLLKTFDPISVTDNANPAATLLESMSRGEVDALPNNDSPYQESIETLCPTWGPSNVPHRLENLASEDEEDWAEKPQSPSNGTASYDNDMRMTMMHSSPGRARHTQHQLVELDPLTSLDSSSVQVPPPDEAKRQRTLVKYGDTQADLRIVFDTSALSALLSQMGQNFHARDQYNPTKARVTAYTEQILPTIIQTWGRVLNIFSATQNIFPPSTCDEAVIPPQHLEQGVEADTIIYLHPRAELSCSLDPRPRISICQFDQHMRPLIGSLSICLNDMDVQKNNVYDKEILRYTALLSKLVGRFLGLSPRLFRYFRGEDGLLLGERQVSIECGDDDELRTYRQTMLSNIIQQREVRDGQPFYEIVSPTVKQVVRNAFDCQSMSGARLGTPLLDPDDNSECVFFDLDIRYHFDEDMTSISQNEDGAFCVSPLSLALLEDSSWYKANFAAAVTPSFGRGAGCGFVESSCIVGGKVPDYSKGFFCANSELAGSRSGCDYTHHNKAGCDLETDISPPDGYQYFLPSNPNYGSPFEDMRYCPMQSKHLVPCSTKGHAMTIPGESFQDNSRCYETDANVPVCLETVCNSKDKMLSVVVNGKSFYCAHDGQVINVDAGYSVICPRIAAVCPDLVCPSNCSGKGVCDYCKEVPECICDNPLDQTDGCWDS